MDTKTQIAEETVFVTGATGFVGSHFVCNGLRQRGTRFVALVRGEDDGAARDRLCALLEQVAASYHEPLPAGALDRLIVVSGNLESEMCGLSCEQVDALRARRLGSFWHFAASLNFENRFRDQIERINVGGTRNALQLANALQVGRFNHVSTAYTCGQARGVVQETLHPLCGPFNNHYERTKCLGEHLVAERCQAEGRPFAILRPSIVVGPRRSMLPGGSDSGLYGFSREICRLRRALRSVEGALRIVGEPDAELNYIPVDQMVSDLYLLHEQSYPAGNIYHLTSQSSPSVAETMAAVAEECGTCPIVVEDHLPEEPSPVERLFERRADFYSSYLKYAKTFSRSWGQKVVVSLADLHTYVRRYLEVRKGSDPNAPFRRSLVVADDGFPLCGYEAGNHDGPVLVLANAYGMPAEVFVPMAEALADRYRLITWESRGVPSALGELRPDACGVQTHAADLRKVMDHFGVQTAAVVGFCTGADVALEFAAAHPERASRVVSVSGAHWREATGRTEFQRNLHKTMPACARGLRHARLYHELIYGQSNSTQQRESLVSWNALMDSLDPALLHMTSLPFREPELLHRYAQLMTRYCRDANLPPAPVSVPLLVLAADDDPIAHHGASVALAQRVAHAQFASLGDAGHFAIYQDTACWDRIARFADRTPTVAVADKRPSMTSARRAADMV